MNKRSLAIGVLILLFAAMAGGGFWCWEKGQESDNKNDESVFPIAPVTIQSHEELQEEEEKKLIEEKISEETSIFDASNWETYRNDEYGFEINIPKGWYTEVMYTDGLPGYPRNCIGGVSQRTSECQYPRVTIKKDSGFPMNSVSLFVGEKGPYASAPLDISDENTFINDNGLLYRTSTYYMGPDFVNDCNYNASFDLKNAKDSFARVSYGVTLLENKEHPDLFCEQLPILPVFDFVIQSFRLTE